MKFLASLASASVLLLSTSSAALFLNEIRVDQSGSDNDEYFEVFSDDPANDNLDGVSLIVIGDGGGGSGTIEQVTTFGDTPLAGDAFYLVAEASFSLGAADLTTALNFENSDNFTYLLVNGFTGMNGDDLDTDDDGVLDNTPWANVIDAVAFIENADVPPTGTEYAYPLTGVSIGPDGAFVPGHIYRDGDGTGPWTIGVFDPAVGDDTPGASNAVIPEPSVSLMLGLAGVLGLVRRRRR